MVLEGNFSYLQETLELFQNENHQRHLVLNDNFWIYLSSGKKRIYHFFTKSMHEIWLWIISFQICPIKEKKRSNGKWQLSNIVEKKCILMKVRDTLKRKFSIHWNEAKHTKFKLEQVMMIWILDIHMFQKIKAPCKII